MRKRITELTLLTGPNIQGKTHLVLTLSDTSHERRFNTVLVMKNQDTDSLKRWIRECKPTAEEAVIFITDIFFEELEENRGPIQAPLSPKIPLEDLVSKQTNGNYLRLDTREIDQMPEHLHNKIKVVL